MHTLMSLETIYIMHFQIFGKILVYAEVLS